MYREKDVQTCLYGLAGWRQNDNPDYITLPASLVASSSGLFFQDDHALVSIENIDQADKNYSKYNYTAYSAATSYALLARVRAVTDGKVYESIDTPNLNHEPSVSPLFWSEVPLLAQRIENLTKSAINKVVASIMGQKKLIRTTKSIFENIQLFDGAGSLLDKELKSGRFVGLQIVVENHRDLTTIIRQLGTQFSQPNPEFKLYIFHSSQETPIYTFEKALTKTNSFEWSTLQTDGLDAVLRYLSSLHSPGGAFYVGYYEDELIGQAINRGYDFSIAPSCGTCNRQYEFYSQWSQYIRVAPISVASVHLDGIKPADVDGPKLWDINQNAYDYSRNYGLNLDLTVACDITDFLCREKMIATRAIIKQVTHDVLNMIAFNTRNNQLAKEIKDLAAYELSNRDGRTGVAMQLQNALDELDFDLSDLNESCLPQNNKYGTSWGSI